MKSTAVIGIGNLLLRDDGFGVHIVKELEKQRFNEKYDVQLIDGGTYIFDLIDVFVKNQKVVIIDSLKGGHNAGTVYKISSEEMGKHITAKTSLHDVQILDLIKDINLMGHFPEVIIIGVEPAEIYFDMELSPIIKSQIPKVIEILKTELERSS
jgi:hydrogenase maturation protease